MVESDAVRKALRVVGVGKEMLYSPVDVLLEALAGFKFLPNEGQQMLETSFVGFAGFPRRKVRFGWEPSQPSSGGVVARDRAWAKRGRSCHRGFLLPFRFPFSGFPPGAQRKGSVVGGTQRAFSSRQAGAGSPGFGARAGLRTAGGRSRSFGRPRGAAGFRGGVFPRRNHSFARLGQKSKLTNGELVATKKSPFVAVS